MRVLAVVHQDDAGPGVFGRVARERGHLEVWRPPEELGPRHVEIDPHAVMIFGGAMDTFQEAEHPWLRRERQWLTGLLERGVPVLGVCLGAQLLAEAAGGSVRRTARPEIGWCEVEVTAEAAKDPVLGALPDRFTSFQWHSYEAVPPNGGPALARTDHSLQAFRIGACAWGIQFHAEVDAPTLDGWIEGYASDPDAVRVGIDPDLLRAESEPAIEGWNRLGSGLCARFLDAATGCAPMGRQSAVM
ncbi:MAG: type 1 glutamine amidotransferase [Thermoleophilaceae bacterium]